MFLTVDADIMSMHNYNSSTPVEYSLTSARNEPCFFALLFLFSLLSVWMQHFELDFFQLRLFCALFNHARDMINLLFMVSWPFQLLLTPLSHSRSLACLWGINCTTNSMNSLARPCISTESTSCSWAFTEKNGRVKMSRNWVDENEGAIQR